MNYQYLVCAYDITDSARRRRLRTLLLPWRVDGQLSVHELLIDHAHYNQLLKSIKPVLDYQNDSLLICHLSLQGLGAVYQPIAKQTEKLLFNSHISQSMPVKMRDGIFVLSYDIVDIKRLNKVYKLVARYMIQLQRSVYLYHGAGRCIQELMGQLVQVAVAGEDDVRLYLLPDAEALQFVAEPVPISVF